MAKSKLKAALDAHKGVDYKKLKEKKIQKEGEKRKRARRGGKSKAKEPEDDEAEEDSEDDEEGGVLIDETAVGVDISKAEETKLQAELKALLSDKKKLMEIDSGSEVESSEEDEGEWESADEEGDEDENMEDDSEDEEAGVAISRLVESESDSDSDDNAESEATDEDLHDALLENGAAFVAEESGEDDATNGARDEDEDEDDIPLSDLDSVASEDKGDIIPHQRLTINNHAALRKAHARIALPLADLPFSSHQSFTTQTNTANSIPDIDDDLARELALYAQSLSAVKIARDLLKKEGVPFSRPIDYFAEMVKSDEHMGKVKDKLKDEAARKKASSEAKRQRDLKKFGKAVQVAKMQERAKEKRDTLDRINTLKRKRAGAMPTDANEPDLFDVSLEDSATTAKKDREARRSGASTNGRSSRDDAGRNSKRQKKDAKFGFGGKKRFNKSTDAESSMDAKGYSAKKMKKPFGGGVKGGKPRLGKSKRAKGKL